MILLYQIVRDGWDDEHEVISTHLRLESAMSQFLSAYQREGVEIVKPDALHGRTDVYNYGVVLAAFPKDEAVQYSIIELEAEE